MVWKMLRLRQENYHKEGEKGNEEGGKDVAFQVGTYNF